MARYSPKPGKPPHTYTAVVHDYAVARTMEMQTSLLAGAAERVWDLWGQRGPGFMTDAQAIELEKAMRDLHNELRETDIFMAGVAAGRAQS